MPILPGFTAEAASSHRCGFYVAYAWYANRSVASVVEASLNNAVQCCPPRQYPTSCVCPPGLTHCGGTCVDLNSDPSNCGNCGKVCSIGEGCNLGNCCRLALDSSCLSLGVSSSGSVLYECKYCSDPALVEFCTCDNSGNVTCLQQCMPPLH